MKRRPAIPAWGAEPIRLFRTAVCLLGGLLMASCATAPSVPSTYASPMPVSEKEFAFQPGDTLTLNFLYWPELDVTQPIRPDGKISLLLVGEIDVAGLSPQELHEELTSMYAEKLKDPEITIVAEVEDNRHVYVGGEVDLFRNTDGLVQVPITGPLTPLEAILEAGGFTNRSAKLSNVLIIRRIDDRQYARTVNLRKVIKNEESEPFYLEPNDIVFVPRTKIDRVDQWVDQYANQVVPDWVNLNVGYTFSRGVSKTTGGTRGTISYSGNGLTVSGTN